MSYIITGGSRGIGRASVLGAVSRGQDCAFSYVANDEAAAKTVEDAERVAAQGARVIAVKGDAADEVHLADLYDQAEGLSPVTGCVVNAGVVDIQATLAEMTAVRIRRIMEINVTGALLTAREAARRMPISKGGPGGSIVFISSIAAEIASPFQYLDYAASKGAIDVATKGLAIELANDGVRVNAVRPGIIDTDIHASGGRPDRARELAHMIPMKRPGTADEMAATILWLMSDEASYVSGAHVNASGAR